MNFLKLYAFVFLSLTASAQNLSFYGILPAINQTGRINSKLNYNLFLSTTIDAFKTEAAGTTYPPSDFQLYIQPSISYLFSQKLNVTGSYTYQRNNPFNGNFSNEHRLWQQIVFSHPFPKLNLNNRFRLEERFIQNRLTGNYPFSSRLRYQLDINKPLKWKKLKNQGYYLRTYNEFYFSIYGAKNAFYSENWAYLGLGVELGKPGKIEFGYLNQVFVRNSDQDLRILNLLQIAWITNFNLKKSKKA